MAACTDILSLVLAAMSATETAEALAQVLAITRIKKRGLSQPDCFQALLGTSPPWPPAGLPALARRGLSPGAPQSSTNHRTWTRSAPSWSPTRF